MTGVEVDPRDPRALIAGALQKWMTDEQITYLIDNVLSIDKLVPVEITCPKCASDIKRRISVPDSKAVVSALTDLLAQGFGRPGEAKLESGSIIFKRLTRMEDDDDGSTDS